MATTQQVSTSARRVAVLVLAALAAGTTSAQAPATPGAAGGAAAKKSSDPPTLFDLRPAGVRTIHVSYVAHTGKRRKATVLIPKWYGPERDPKLPLVISPHGRGLDGAKNAKLWGDLPGLGGFAVVSPDGTGDHLDRYSWGAPGQIRDLAAMPDLVRRALPWLHIDASRLYAVGGSMGGQETLLLVARYPQLLAGASAVDSVTDFSLQYKNYPRLRCLGACRKQFGSIGKALQSLVRREVGGDPSTAAAAFAQRSPLRSAKAIAESGVRLQLWWSTKDRIVVDSGRQTGALWRQLRQLEPIGDVDAFVGSWRHTAVLRADAELPAMLSGLDLLPKRLGSTKTHLTPWHLSGIAPSE